jgi:hypothetical protein
MMIKPSSVLAVAVIVLILIIWVKGFWLTEVFHSTESNEPNRAALLQIHSAVALGASHAEVLAVYWQHRTNSLYLDADRPADWAISMPLEWGASDWRLLIAFQDGKAISIQMRTSDGPPPDDGPMDK